MIAKEIQKEFLRSYLKPLLKKKNFQTSGQTWWRDQGYFFIVLNLQSSAWNDKNHIHFFFNIGIALKQTLKDPQKKRAGYFDLTVFVREDFYLSENRKSHKYRDPGGYNLKEETDLTDFIREFQKDFDGEIMPKLDSLINLKECITLYQDVILYGDNLKQYIRENNVPLN